jgi:hypothetical protein
MRTKRFLLVTAALSTVAASAAGTVACGKNAATPERTDAETLPLPANPKGSFYDANIEPTPDPPPPAADAEAPKDGGAIKQTPPPIKDAGVLIKPHPLPANPKGSFYDGGKRKPGSDF